MHERFGKDQLLKEAHYKALMSLPSASREVSKLRATWDEMEKHIRVLGGLGENTEQSFLITLIKSKIPVEIMEQLEISKGAEEWTVSLLRERLRIHLNA